jgi:TonB family protein
LQDQNGQKPGITVIELEIRRDGSLRKMSTVASAGDATLDAVAADAISSSAPFPHLPETYQDKVLNLRMGFGYDQPGSKEIGLCDGPNSGAHSAAYDLHESHSSISHPKPTFAPDPEYSEQARLKNYMSVVKIAGTVDPQGSFTDLCLMEAAGVGLDDKAFEAVRRWQFEPATLNGQPVAVRILVEVTFRLY